MKTLLIVRHAKSSWKDPGLADHQRPLNKRGKKDAPEMGKRLRKRGLQPDIIFSSDARRASDTAVSMAETIGISPELVRLDPALYHAEPDFLLDTVHQFKRKWKRVMVVGHNPTLTELVNRFYPRTIANIPTAGIVEFRFKTRSWDLIDRDNLDYSSFDFPKNK